MDVKFGKTDSSEILSGRYYSDNDPEVIFTSSFNPQAVGWDTGVPFSLSNFLEDILQPTSFKMSPTSKSGLKL